MTVKTKAFDLVHHNILLKKLECYKCNETCLRWFESYLTNRTQRVSLGNNLSEPASVTCCVPQDSILGPLLFLVFINDLPLSLQSSSVVGLYADDTTFYDFQNGINQFKKKKKKKKKKGKRKVQGVPQSQTAALPRPQEEEETDKSKQAQTEQTYEKH